ncbi:hypothetical protein [Rosettibacter firmus]|uniref:hypothetical protein n=1 Tax=Rosettibacter firmus TaxID=3111522 RepID=UPI00336BB0C8
MVRTNKNKFFNYNFPKEHCVFKDEETGVLLYQADCLTLMDLLIKKYPEGIFDKIFVDSPYGGVHLF